MQEALKENCDVIIGHRQTSPESAELLAQMCGTHEVVEYTHQEEGTFGRLLGRNSGLRSKRLTDQFRVHPNQIKELRKGEALVIDKTNGLRVRVIKVRKEIRFSQITRRRR